MSDLRKAAEMALDALCEIEHETFHPAKVFKHTPAIISLRTALAQFEQEPVAWTTKGQIAAMDAGFQHYIQGRVPRFVAPTENDVPLYTAPPKRERSEHCEWVGLTDEEIRDIHWSKPMDEYSYARAIEAKLKEKNFDA